MTHPSRLRGVPWRPRLGPLLAAAALVGIAAALLDARLRAMPARGLPLAAVLAHERDDHGFVVHETANFAAGSPAVVLVGSSALREGVEAAPVMRRRLEQALGRPVAYANLSTFDQTLAESFLLVSNLRLGPGSLLVLEVKPRRFSADADELAAAYNHPRLATLDEHELLRLLLGLGLPVSAAPTVWRDRTALRHYVEGRIAPHVREAVHGLVTLRCGWSCMAALGRGPWWRTQARYLAFAYPDRSLDGATLARMAEEIRGERLPAFRRNAPLSAALARAIIDRTVADGAAVILLELPHHRLSREAYAPVGAAYAALVRDLASRGAVYVDWSDDPGFGDADFFDLDHLRPAGRRRLTERLIGLIRRADAFASAAGGDEAAARR